MTHYSKIKGALAVLEEKPKIYLVEFFVKNVACCILDKFDQIYEKDFMDTLNCECRNLESMGKFYMHLL